MPALSLVPQHFPFKYLSTLDARCDASELVCTATVLDVKASGQLPVVEGVRLREHLVTADIDRVFKGNWTEQTITFRWLGLYSPDGITQYVGPPIDDFKPNSRYLIFLRNGPAPEVVTPVLGTAILLAARGAGSQYRQLVPPVIVPDKAELAAEMVAAISAAPPLLRTPADYFEHIGELLGGAAAAGVFESFYGSADPAIRVVASAP